MQRPLSPTPPAPRRAPVLQAVLLAAAGVAVLGVAAWFALRPAPPVETPTPPPATAATPAAPAPAAPAPAAPAPAATAPSFDIVRVAPSGSAVIAGRAAPGADVTVQANGHEIGHAQANAQGQWVITPTAPLAPGGEQLTLSATGPGGTPTPGSAPVVVVVPPATGSATASTGTAPPGAVAVLTPPNAAPRLLQAPQSRPTGAAARLGLDVVDYDERGDIRFAGMAPPGATVRVYVDNRLIGDAVAGADGHWTLAPGATVAPGAHRLRLDQIGKGNTVAARLELPFERAANPPLALAPGQTVVQPGQSLWRIARQTYGEGVRYTEIYTANRTQIRDPNLIYPGQVFALPTVAPAGTPAGTATPTSSSKSR